MRVIVRCMKRATGRRDTFVGRCGDPAILRLLRLLRLLRPCVPMRLLACSVSSPALSCMSSSPLPLLSTPTAYICM